MKSPSVATLIASFRAKVRETGLRDTVSVGLRRALGQTEEFIPLARTDTGSLFSTDLDDSRERAKNKMRTSAMMVDASTVESRYPEIWEYEDKILRYAFHPATKDSRGLVVVFHGHNAHLHLGPESPWEQFDLLVPWDTFGWNRQGSWFWGEKGEGFVETMVQALIRERRGDGQAWFCMGSSMGGFGALLHGIKYGCDGIYAMMPQIDLRAKIVEYGADNRDNPYGYLQGETLESVPDVLSIASQQDELPPLFLVQNQYDPVNPFAAHGFKLLDVYNEKRGWYGVRVYPAIGHGADGSQLEAELFFTLVSDTSPPSQVDFPYL